ERRPLILMLRVMDAPGTENDLFHYVVASGVDASLRLVRIHYGDGKRRWASIDKMEPAWAAGGHALFLIGAKTKRVATESDLRRAVVLEAAGKIKEAVALYRHFLDSHPESSLAWTNLANAHATAADLHSAEVAYRNALFIDRENCDALNNLAWLLLGLRRLDEAEPLARRALAVDCHDRDLVDDTLAKILAAKGTP
ncbi:MAG TPA: tetratricopeptide repeat protein, partial [Thermoanaerobaculia bacterium]